jgi:hypothetical protein
VTVLEMFGIIFLVVLFLNILIGFIAVKVGLSDKKENQFSSFSSKELSKQQVHL